MSDSIQPPPGEQLRRIEVAAALLEPCFHCDDVIEVIRRWPDGLVRAVGVTHEIGCPEYLTE